MTGDSPKTELDTDDLVENSSRVVQTNREGHSNGVAGDVSSSTELQTSDKTPRREVRWIELDKSANDRSLKSIMCLYEESLECVWASSANSPLRRITASRQKMGFPSLSWVSP